MTALTYPARRRRLFSNGDSSRMLIVVAIGAAMVMVALSSGPTGIAGPGWFLASIALLITTCTWIAVAIESIVRRRPASGLVVAPLVGLVTVAVLITGVPSVLRFALIDRVAFERVVAQASAPVVALPDHDLTDDESYASFADFPGPCPTMIGMTLVQDCEAFAAGYLFYDWAGSGVLDDGGVAYLPEGVPSHEVGNGSFESPQFRHLVGPWYSFSSSW